MYISYSCLVFTFLNNLQTIIQHFHKHYSIIIMGDFNVNILKDNNQFLKNKNYYIS
jgi:exonuclease III